MPRHDDQLTRRNAEDAVAHLDHLANRFVAECERAFERRQSGDDRAVEIAGGRRDRLDDRVAIGLQRRHRGIDVSKLSTADVFQPSHHVPLISGRLSARSKTPNRKSDKAARAYTVKISEGRLWKYSGGPCR
jgi:hypothetical protein